MRRPALAADGRSLEQSNLDEMESLWEAAKVGEKLGTKIGNKVGGKIGQKLGVKLGTKTGIKA